MDNPAQLECHDPARGSVLVSPGDQIPMSLDKARREDDEAQIEQRLGH